MKHHHLFTIVAFCGALLTLGSGCEKKPAADVEAPVVPPTDEVPAAEAATEEAAPAAAAEEAAPVDPRIIQAPEGAVRVTPYQHASLMLTTPKGHIIQIDPWQEALTAAREHDREIKKADVILLTDVHPDHLDPKAIEEVRGEGATVVAPKAVVEKAGEEALGSQVKVLANGESATLLGGDLVVEAVPMYNLERKMDNGEFYHPRGRGNGYILKVAGAKIYVSGDTECTPEVKALEGIDAAFLSMNLPYTMPVEEAAACINVFQPDVIYPYHHRGQDVSRLDELVTEDEAVDVRVLDWYPGQEQEEGGG